MRHFSTFDDPENPENEDQSERAWLQRLKNSVDRGYRFWLRKTGRIAELNALDSRAEFGRRNGGSRTHRAKMRKERGAR